MSSQLLLEPWRLLALFFHATHNSIKPQEHKHGQSLIPERVSCKLTQTLRLTGKCFSLTS